MSLVQEDANIMSDTNGWTKWGELVLFRLDRLDGANTALINKIDEVDDRLVRMESNLKNVYVKAAAIAGVVALAVAIGSRAVYELAIRILF